MNNINFRKIKILNDYKSLAGIKTIQCINYFTNKICNRQLHYVEIGVFRGNSIINNALNSSSKIRMIGIDNFSFFKNTGNNFRYVKNNLKKNKLKNVKILKIDFEKAFEYLLKKKIKIGVLYIDGPHDYRSQLISLEKYKKLLSINSVIIVDDANYYHVRKATQDFLNNNLDFKLIYQKYSPKHIANSSSKEKEILKNNFLNGINIIINKKNKYFKNKEKKIKFQKNEIKLKKIFIDSHEIFRHYYAYNGKEIFDLIYDLKRKKINITSFNKQLKKINPPKYLKKQIKFKSQNLF
jgi:hypothetical protein